jgi:hypothetical protein
MKHRIGDIMRESIEQLDIDLQGLTVLTEAATGPYLYTPIVAALAGSTEVIGVTDDSEYASKETVRERTLDAAAEWNVDDRIRVVFDTTPDDVGASDIITNTGFVRPIDESMITEMKPTAVVPLMWETWETRGDVDLRACSENDILVLGTDESEEPVRMYDYAGFVAMKLLFELGLEGNKTETLLLGTGEGTGRSIYTHFSNLDMDITWFSDHEPEANPYDMLSQHYTTHGERYDVILVAEHHNDTLLLGENGKLSYEEIQQISPSTSIGVISGNIERDGLEESGLNYFPPSLKPFGQMSYQAFHLGPRGPIELYAGGLKVGEVMARCRNDGLDLSQAKEYTLANAPAMAVDDEQYSYRSE